MNPKEIEIPITFHNYKLLKDVEFNLTGSCIYFVRGPNEVGKTTFLNALKSIQLAKDDTPEKVTRGEQEGYNEFMIPGADGKKYLIKHEFSANKDRFIAIDERGVKVSTVTDIRKIFNYTHFTAREFFDMSNTADGRRKQKEIILKLLTDNERSEYNVLIDKEDLAFEDRKGTKQDFDIAKKSLSSMTLTNDEKKLIKSREVLVSDAKILNDTIQQGDNARKRVSEIDKLVENASESIKHDQDIIDKLEEQIKWQIIHSNELIEERDAIVVPDPEDVKRAEVDLPIITSQLNEIGTLLGLEDRNISTKEEYERLEKDIIDLENTIKSIRERKQAIITESDLPFKNVEFEDNSLKIDGFEFKESQVCESKAILLVSKIMAKINPGPIQIIGDASLLDTKSLAELNSIAEKEEKIMFIDEVDRDGTQLHVVGYEELKSIVTDNTIKTGKKPVKAPKKTSTPKVKETTTKKEIVQKVVPKQPLMDETVEDKPLF